MTSPLELLRYAFETYPDKVEVLVVDERVAPVSKSARQNEHHAAYLQVSVPDELARNYRGQASKRDLIVMVRVPREVAERKESRIILPTEFNSSR